MSAPFWISLGVTLAICVAIIAVYAGWKWDK